MVYTVIILALIKEQGAFCTRLKGFLEKELSKDLTISDVGKCEGKYLICPPRSSMLYTEYDQLGALKILPLQHEME